MDTSPSTFLLCEENVGYFDEEKDEFASILESDDDDNEYIQTILDKEISNDVCQMQDFLRNCAGDWIEKARTEGVQYILRKKDSLGFGFETANLSVTYLDRFLSRRSIDEAKSWAVRLLAIACLSLAAKMEECVVIPLSEFCADGYNFESIMIQKMELLVLSTLEWKMGSVTPFAYINFFLKRLCENENVNLRNFLSRTVQVILDATKDVKIMCHSPSVIAAAATLFVLNERLTKNTLELKISPLSSDIVLNIEDVNSCYEQVKQMDMLNKGIKSPDLSPSQVHMYEATGGPSVTPGASGKRKRLIFNHSDDDKQEKKQKHLSSFR